MKELSRIALAIEPSATMAIDTMFKQMKADGLDVIGFGAGEPDFPTPDYIKEVGIQAIQNNDTKYTPSVGTVALRKAICQRLKEDCGVEYTPAEVAVSNGAKPCVYVALRALVNPGDEVIILEPAYISYLQLARAAHARAVPVHAKEENGWLPDLDELRAAVTPKTKLLVLNTPGNPTGVVYPREVLQQIAALAQEQDFLVLSDEVYEKLIYGGAQHVSIASLDGMKERTITINGFSKAFAMTGWRMGYLAADARLILPMLKVHQYAVASSNIIAQSAAITALQAGESCVEEMRREYARRRQFLLDAFAQIPEISCVAPAGTFYIYPNISGTGLSGTEFADKFLMEAGVATVPGTAFDSFCNSHIRLSYASSMESLQTAVSRLKGMLKK